MSDNSNTNRAQHAFVRAQDRYWDHSFERPGQARVRISAPKTIRRANWLGRFVDWFATLVDKRQA
jgi:hypothetical protein